MNAIKHSQLSCSCHGEVIEDYYPIHQFLDSAKSLCADGRHRFLHPLWAVNEIVVPIFGHTLENSDGRKLNVKDLCERDHLLPDYANRFIPTLGDFVAAMSNIETERWQSRIKDFHTDHVTDTAISRLLLSPLSVTGQLKSLMLTHNSWFLNEIVPRVFPEQTSLICQFSISPDDVFVPMRFVTPASQRP